MFAQALRHCSRAGQPPSACLWPSQPAGELSPVLRNTPFWGACSAAAAVSHFAAARRNFPNRRSGADWEPFLPASCATNPGACLTHACRSTGRRDRWADLDGFTALVYASMWGHASVVEVVLGHLRLARVKVKVGQSVSVGRIVLVVSIPVPSASTILVGWQATSAVDAPQPLSRTRHMCMAALVRRDRCRPLRPAGSRRDLRAATVARQ
eukprot:COSAG01_NODE_13215_length_1619_cov_1.426316_2_plen_210_part_00